MSSTNTNILKKDEKSNENNEISKQKLIDDYANLIDNIIYLIKNLNDLIKLGYPNIININLKIEKSKAFEENNIQNELENIIEFYKNINKNFKKAIKKGYENYPYLRLFYVKHFIQLHKKTKNENIDISNLVNAVTLNKIKNFDIEYKYDDKIDNIENINKYLIKLFETNHVSLDELYNINKVLNESDLKPGLYRKIKASDYSNLVNSIINIYLNLTGNAPIFNTLLICNEDTSIEQIKAFLYRAIFCEKPILFLITNMECLDFTVTHNLIKTLRTLYKLKNKVINSFLLFIYEKVDSGLVRDIEKLIPENKILNNIFLEQSEKKNSFDKIELYSSKFSGYGKTTEIKYKVAENEGIYKYLPIGGSLTKNYIIKNLENLKLDLKIGNKIYLHLDLSETDNHDLMNEILFKLIILKFLNSEEKIIYIGYDINLIIEIPQGFIDFEKKYKFLNLFNKIYIDKLKPLRLEENVKNIIDSPISIVAEVLTLYDNNKIGTTNINLNDPISKSEMECEKIINKYFTIENKNYYQKINFIKILSIQFKKFTENIYFNYKIAEEDGKEELIEKARKSVIKNFIELTKIFTCSPFDSVLLKQKKSRELFGKYDENQDREDGINSLIEDKKEIFSFEKISPSLVFFNKDGGSLSIISNNNKNEQGYKDLKELWNSQNPDKGEEGEKELELEDYKNMDHENFLEQIKILFSLNKMKVEDLKELCEELGNYIFVSDNFIKMVRILLNIEAKIPVILMGETGVGKTKLLEMLSKLYSKSKENYRW